MVYKRASGRTKKVKKNHSNDSQKEASVKQRREKDEIAKHQNFTITPRQMIRFELEDAKYSEDYEKLRKTRKLRTKRTMCSGQKVFIGFMHAMLTNVT